jgi:hypothetical protein
MLPTKERLQTRNYLLLARPGQASVGLSFQDEFNAIPAAERLEKVWPNFNENRRTGEKVECVHKSSR